MLKIVNAPAPVLTQKVRPVAKVDKKIQKLVYDMEETLITQVDPQGVGLAAPQVGVDLAIFIIKPTLKANTQVFINPKIVQMGGPGGGAPRHARNSPNGEEHWRGGELGQDPSEQEESDDVKLEGCLSIPRVWGPVERSTKVQVEYQDLTGERHVEWFKGFKAVIIQHEVDHLHGVLFTERVLEQKGKLYEEKDGELHAIS